MLSWLGCENGSLLANPSRLEPLGSLLSRLGQESNFFFAEVPRTLHFAMFFRGVFGREDVDVFFLQMGLLQNRCNYPARYMKAPQIVPLRYTSRALQTANAPR